MTNGADVLAMLIPQGGWIITGEEYENIEFLECDPISREEFEAGFAQFETWKAQKTADDAASKSALLARLGITENEARLLLS